MKSVTEINSGFDTQQRLSSVVLNKFALHSQKLFLYHILLNFNHVEKHLTSYLFTCSFVR